MMVMEEVNPQQLLLSELEGINTARKYFMRFTVNSNMMAASAVLRMRCTWFRQKVKRQQPT